MSRIASRPVSLPKGVELNLNGEEVQVKGPKGELSLQLSSEISLSVEDGEATVAALLQV